jgi:hypothetical protein
MIIPIVLGSADQPRARADRGVVRAAHIPRALSAAVVLLTWSRQAGGCSTACGRRRAPSSRQLPTAAKRLRQNLEHDRPTAASAIQQVQKAATELEKATSPAAAPAPPSGVQRVQVESPPINISDYVMWGSLGAVARSASWC